ncbi:cell wall assembly regulator SMI1 [Micromonospora palomenae]|uniref:Cell wall assembly regulator SMI1 n=2 Tax=Micromonospora palomenae TaxID=1461247 RepID=A0A561VK66_9ACTN|nr:cell wall assembly regulator SMI1 [Micromonospora palomenae]
MVSMDRAMVAEAAIRRIDAWLQQHAPRARAVLRPPASETDLVAAQDAVGRQLPPDLRAWWLYADGARFGLDADGGTLIPPGFVPYSVDEALKSRRLWMDVARQLALFDQLEAFISSENSRPAGTRCDTWLPAWLPVATNRGGGNLFVDLRGGPKYGCVMEFYRDAGAVAEPEWADMAAMLYDIADRLAENEAYLDNAGRIFWP